jgi:hypothetical protein
VGVPNAKDLVSVSPLRRDVFFDPVAQLAFSCIQTTFAGSLVFLIPSELAVNDALFFFFHVI